MATGFPAPVLTNIPSDGLILATGSLLNSTYDVIPPGLHEATLHSWNVAFQRQLPFGLAADIAYVGSRGVNLVMDLDTNASLVYGSGNVGRPQFAQFNRTGTSRTRTNLGKSQYNGLQVKVDRRFSHGLLITNSYTLGRSNDLAQENGGVSTPINFDLSWGRSDTDRLHNYVLSTVYELPWGPNKRWMNDSTLGKIVGGWQVSGLFIAQSGQALTITGNGTLLNTPGNSAFADQATTSPARRGRTAAPSAQRTTGRAWPQLFYFDTRCIRCPGARAGNMARHRTRWAGLLALDMSLFKRFAWAAAPPRFRGRQTAERRAVGQPGHGIQHRDRQHVRPDHRHQRRPAQPSLRIQVRVLTQ